MYHRVNISKILEGFEKGLNIKTTAAYAGASVVLTRTHLRKHGKILLGKETPDIKRIVEAHSWGLSTYEVAKKLELTQTKVTRIWMERGLKPHNPVGFLVGSIHCSGIKGPRLEQTVIAERKDFLKRVGLDEIISPSHSFLKILSDVKVMEESYNFFKRLGADPIRTFRKYPSLLCHDANTSLEPKRKFLVDEIGLPEEKLARKTDIFTCSLSSMRKAYRYYTKKFKGDREKARALLRVATTIFGNKKKTINNKILAYERAHIDFHRNYILLEKNPRKVIATRNYLRDEVRLSENQNDMWYYMLLAIDKETLMKKTDYCEKEGIDWKKVPRILLLGLGTENEPGALVRRVNMIKETFSNIRLPESLDYKIKPQVIVDTTDSGLMIKLNRYKN